MLLNEQREAFEAFRKTAFENHILDARTATIAGLACAMALRCEKCIQRFLDQGRELDLSSGEIATVAAIAMCVRAGSARNTVTESYEAWLKCQEEEKP